MAKDKSKTTETETDKDETPEKEATIRLHNKGKRSHQISFPQDPENPDEDTSPKYFNPGSVGNFPMSIGNKLRKLYPDEIVSLDDVSTDFTAKEADFSLDGEAKTDTAAQASPAGLEAGGTISRE